MNKWGNYILVMMGVLAALIMTEAGARILGYPFERGQVDMYQCNRLVGWRGTANLVTSINTEGYQHQVIRNSQGMHDNEHSLKKEENVFRILMLGDSFTEAQEVDEKQTSHQILEDTLNTSAPVDTKFEVISAGIAAWGPAQELMYFRSEGYMYNPDLVLALWVPANDLLDILPDYRLTHAGINCYAPYFAICDEQFDSRVWFSAPGVSPIWERCSESKKMLASGLNYLYFNSRLYQHLEPLFMKNSHRIEYSHPFAPWFDRYKTDEVLNYAYQLTDQIYAQLAKEASENGTKIVLVIVPPKQAIYADVQSDFYQQLPPDWQDINSTLPNQTFTELMTAREIPVLDLHPHFVERIRQNGEPLYWQVNSHWNVTGNRVVGEVIASWLIERGLVPTTAGE